MASIVSTGIGSGLDIAGIVASLVAAEGQPAETRLGLAEARAQARLSAFGSLKSALADLRDKLEVMKSAESFLVRKAASSDENLFTASAGTGAYPASYALEVIQLAQAQRLTSAAFADSDTVVGTGTLTIDVGGSSMDLEITADNNTLAGIRDTINSSSDNPGVAATIVNAESGSFLILTAEETGAVNTMTVTQSGGDGGLAALEYDPAAGLTALTESTPALDALIRIDGLDVSGDTNEFAGVIDGVTISVTAESSGGPAVLTVENDDDAVRTIVADFVESYNALVTTLDSLTAYDSETALAAPLLGDATVRGIRDQIRRELSTAVADLEADFSTLSEVGIETQLDGTLSIDDDALASVLAGDFVKFGQLFSATGGFGVRLHGLVDGFLDSDGILENRTDGIETKLQDIGDERVALNERLGALEIRLLRQFNALDSLLAELSSTSNFLAQQLNNLPGVESGTRNSNT